MIIYVPNDTNDGFSVALGRPAQPEDPLAPPQADGHGADCQTRSDGRTEPGMVSSTLCAAAATGSHPDEARAIATA